MIVKGRWAHGDIGKARTILVGLLRGMLPWSCSRIGAFPGIREKAGKIGEITESDPHVFELFGEFM
jgi:hypothetical protein